jgi:hypothetical protein
METDADAALEEGIRQGIDLEYWRILGLIDQLCAKCNPETGYGRNQIRTLGRLRASVIDGSMESS